MATKYLKGPAAAWDLLFETLNLDAQSSALDKDLRKRIEKSLNQVEYMDVPKGSPLLTVPKRSKVLLVPQHNTGIVLTPQEKRYLVEFLGPDITLYTETKVTPNVPQNILKKLVESKE